MTRFKSVIFVILICALFITGCRSYDYTTYNNRAENALRDKNFGKAKELFSYIYQQEQKAEPVNERNIIWAYYRLGVIHELTGDLKLAKGYYWGDSTEEGFYSSDPKIEWFAKTGWKLLDLQKPSRSLDEIIKLELTGKLPAQKMVRQKKQIEMPRKKRQEAPKNFQLPQNQPTRVFNRSLTPPPPSTPEPFRVLY